MASIGRSIEPAQAGSHGPAVFAGPCFKGGSCLLQSVVLRCVQSTRRGNRGEIALGCALKGCRVSRSRLESTGRKKPVPFAASSQICPWGAFGAFALARSSAGAVG